MNWTIMFFETTKVKRKLKKDLQLESTQNLLLNYLKAKNENRILPKAYYRHFYMHYLEAWTLLGDSERNLCEVFKYCRDMLVKVYKEDSKKLSQLELAMNKKWNLVINEQG